MREYYIHNINLNTYKNPHCKKLGWVRGKAMNFPSKVANNDDEDGVMCLYPYTLIGYRVSQIVPIAD
jgi:ABC-type antimicrobial peptide transport system ATPase subunit